MSVNEVEVVVVGGGQAGIALSEHLRSRDIEHVVLERNRIAERWRSERWDSLVANGPAWHDRFPGLEFNADPDAFVTKHDIIQYFESYAEKFNAPIKTGVDVTSVRRAQDGAGFDVQTSDGTYKAQFVVAATGPFQKPIIPAVIPDTAAVEQMHSSNYRNPAQLPEGAVLVVGAGSSGVQIADELRKAGRQVYLSVGPHDRPPRRYRNRDNVWWLGVLGKWEATAPTAGAEHVTIAVSGVNGGHTVDMRNLAASGITLVGRTNSFSDGTVNFGDDLGQNIANGDANYLSVLDEADAYIARHSLDLPEEPQARVFGPTPDCVTNPLKELNLSEAGITSIIWATGYDVDFSWLQVDALTPAGKPQHQRGVSSEPGVYFLGQAWLSRRGSPFIWGVWHDAKFIADHIGIQRGYMAYQGDARVVTT
ncbi:MAG: SidA/IucD/PvdA family monooxygenase [Actinobacteria bacterium]|nr:SidA/IucD/PvdA family monooxygenase [Actinomycetota bacterium]